MVRPEAIHLTSNFGLIRQMMWSALPSLSGAIEGWSPFEVRVQGMGFPRSPQPQGRLGGHGPGREILTSLQQAVEKKIAELPFL
jgi:hypothetical protein